MPSVEELLNQDSEDEYINISPINDIITIDPETRTINLPASETLFGTEQEMNVERKYFKCPKIVGDNIDLSKHQIYITYVTAKDNTGTFLPEEELGLYYCEDMAVDGDYITFSWLLSGNVLNNHGFIAFAVSAKHTDGEVLKTRWKTRPAVGTVLLTVPDGKAIIERYPDIITQLLDRMNAVEEIATEEAMQRYVDDYLGRNPVQLDPTLTDSTKAAPADLVGEIKGDLEQLKQNGTGTGTGLSTEAIDKLEEVGNYLAYTTADGGSKWTELISILRNGSSGGGSGETEVTLSSISATYTGGEVTTGTALSDLTGITVTATYSDGTTKTVTGYTLSGEILEGENTITVSYGGKTTTFTVTGIVEGGGGEVTAELPTDGLVGYFDFRTCEYNNAGSGGSTLIQPTQGNGQLFAWSNNAVNEQNEYGMKMARNLLFDGNGGTTQSECGESFTWVFKCYLTNVSSPMFALDYGSLSNMRKLTYSPKYNTASSTAKVAGEGFGNRLVDAYDLLILVVDNNICKLYFENELIKEIDGSSIDGFVSWYSKLSVGILGSYNYGYLTQLAIYNKALSEVEITEMQAYLKTLEVA